ncbi:coiled-coil-helix-coiled-coil-helix domain-containing protein [Aspergillus ruber CBS 135680]|uniref:Mitochondrial intermembrane space import and assembly protein 40 n=1 Tax=Aspergillus ruber (strain CBS 135680) TaxID=1388766 RepID=A0A017SPE3_ASPRC|nr:uncharacterized protein EURHEDRAFT_409001 [Aspergillus ruber CBS 135680]EYE98661.1 hypothetical protein EURHEDRAFT_409001 [Aspergillus ruber CBS 135680]
MFRPAPRALLRASSTPFVAVRGPVSRRLVSTASSSGTPKSRSWKSTFVRFGLAAGAVYYYNTNDIFAGQPSFSLRNQVYGYEPVDEKSLPTLNSIEPKIRKEREQERQREQAARAAAAGKSPEQLEEEAGQEAAFNPETGEINWDCPCLGGMAHGPCGEEFKAAFSCFVYSNDEPKGIDCIEKFKGMQDCFRAHPDVYGAELEDDDAPAENPTAPSEQEVSAAVKADAASHPDEKHARAKEVKTQVASAAAKEGEQAESDELIPKAWHDTESKNTESKAQKLEK